jgi:hypothetical protein
MKYFQIYPEVAGGWGKNTIVSNRDVHPPIIEKLDYQFEGWLGDDILETFPCYIISKALADAFNETNLAGFKLEEVEISLSETFIRLYGNKILPKFYWFKIIGNANSDDFFTINNHSLIISEKALEVMKLFNINNAEIEDYEL